MKRKIKEQESNIKLSLLSTTLTVILSFITITLEKQLYFSLPVFKIYSITIKSP